MNAKLTNTNKFLALGLAGLSLTTDHDVLAIETPDYQVALRQGGVEFRYYKPFIIAETLVSGEVDYRAAARQGFRRLFNYISGDNLTKERILMTAPVRQLPASAGQASKKVTTDVGWKISFVLPGKYTRVSAPVASDSRIRIREVPAQLMAALQYNGRWTQEILNKHTQQLHINLQKMAVRHGNNTLSAVYNSPFSLPFLRRNEVMVSVANVPTKINHSGINQYHANL